MITDNQWRMTVDSNFYLTHDIEVVSSRDLFD